jgi:uncharacterized protein YecE (DUF72 family)
MATNENITVYSLSKKFKNHLRIGTCSWNYPEWQKIGIYSAKQKRHYDYLPEYSQHYNTAEVDQWFWSLYGPDNVKLPSEEDVEAYANLTPEDFKFTIKVPNSVTLTHFYKQAPKQFAEQPNPNFLSKKIMDAFLKAIKPLKKKVGVIMFEFEYLNKEKMPTLEAFMDQLGPFLNNLPADYKFAIENRNKNFYTEEYFKFLKSHNVGHVFVDGYFLPSADSVFEKFGNVSLPTKSIVIRLLGADRQAMEKKTGKYWTKIVEPRDQTIKEVAEFIEKLIPQKVDVYANFNNHLEGSAPLSIAKFIDLLSGV